MQHFNIRWVSQWAWAIGFGAALAAASALGCGGDSGAIETIRGDLNPEGGAGQQSSPIVCNKAKSHEKIPQRVYGAPTTVTVQVADLVTDVVTLCGQCHLGKNDTPFELPSPFTVDALRDRANPANSRMVLQTLSGAMPPNAGADNQRRAVALGGRLQAWVNLGYPADSFMVSSGSAGASAAEEGMTVLPPQVAADMTDLASCVPEPGQARGQDPERDAYFAGLTSLPKFLSQTDSDIYTLDAQKLATHGTYAYVPNYQLFSDNAKKLRLIHVPAGTSITYDPETQHFNVPPNTRVYKTFFKYVVDATGIGAFRKMETRIIVTRADWHDALFGSYVWNEDETVAELHDARYRDGTPFTDRVLTYTTDEGSGATRNYAVPGSLRCIQCHQGAEGQNFLLGFTPLEINRRPPGEGGGYDLSPLQDDEMSQVDRLLGYGVISGFASASDLPKLEDSALRDGRVARTPEELTAQGYMFGNCSNCHNPKGYAVTSNPFMAPFNLAPGGVVFGFPATTEGKNSFPANGLVDPYGVAYLVAPVWQKLGSDDGDGDTELTSVSSSILEHMNPTSVKNLHMPLNVPGLDCRAQKIFSKWRASLDAPNAPATGPFSTAASWAANRELRIQAAENNVCTPPDDIYWTAYDSTEKIPYTPRNLLWQDGVPADFAAHGNFAVTADLWSGLRELSTGVYYAGFWDQKSTCKFPFVADAAYPAVDSAKDREAWMLDSSGAPKANWGSLYQVTPPAAVFNSVCRSCHGPKGDGDTVAAKVLTALKGYRVANFREGLFGPVTQPGQNLATFDSVGVSGAPGSGAAAYMAWMASGGTKLHFPYGFGPTWVGPGLEAANVLDIVSAETAYNILPNDLANMLGSVRGICNLIRQDNFESEGRAEVKTLWTAICTWKNTLTPAIKAASLIEDPLVDNWLYRATFNAGAMAYIYMEGQVLRNEPPALYPSECEKRKP